MKKLLALVLSMLLVASCFALVAFAEEETTTAAEETTVAEETTTEAVVDGTEGEETTAAEGETTAAEGETTAAEGETTAAEGETTAAEEESTEAAPSYENNKLVFDKNAKGMKVLTNPNLIESKEIFSDDWTGAKLQITDGSDPFINIQWATYIKKAKLDKLTAEDYPYIAFKMKVEGPMDDVELFYCAGEVRGASGEFMSTSDYSTLGEEGEYAYVVFDLSDDFGEGIWNMFRFDPLGADETTVVYLYEMAMFKTEDEVLAYAGIEKEPETTAAETEAPTTEAPTTEAPTTEAATEAEEGGCKAIAAAPIVALIAVLGVAFVAKKKD